MSTEQGTPPTDTPKIPGKEPIFRHLDDPDMTWQKVRRQRNRTIGLAGKNSGGGGLRGHGNACGYNETAMV